MFPFFTIPGTHIDIYLFGVTLSICFFLFIFMLHKLSAKFAFDFGIFKRNIALLFVSTFVFSRIFYILSQWHEFQYISNPLEFFIMTDYNFSLFGAIFGFLGMFYLLIKKSKEHIDKYIHGIVLSFLFVLPAGFIGALLGGQVYGMETSLGIELTYTHSYTSVPYTAPIFPLPIVYAIMFFGIFSGLYISSLYVKQKYILGYLGLALFAMTIFSFDFLSGKLDFFKQQMYAPNMNQYLALIIFGYSVYKLYTIYKK